MAGIFKTKAERAKGRDGKYTSWWIDRRGKKRSKVVTADAKAARAFADDMEYRERRYRAKLDDPAEVARREASERPIAEHVADYRAHLEAKGNTPLHVTNTASAIARLLDLGAIGTTDELTPDRVQAGVARLRAPRRKGEPGRSARTCNHALGAVKSFARWLADTGRIKDFPAGLRTVKPLPEKSDRRRVRRALTPDELERLIAATEAGPATDYRAGGKNRHSAVTATLPAEARAWAYRVAMATGFRAQEVRTLTPERFALDGPEPTVTVLACYSKRGKRSGRDDVQPIPRAFAESLRAFLDGKPAGVPLFPLPPTRTAAILADDLRRAGIEPVDGAGRVLDFHSLRYSYITNLIGKGVNPKVAQRLARHSSITLTLDRYTIVRDDEARRAIEGDG